MQIFVQIIRARSYHDFAYDFPHSPSSYVSTACRMKFVVPQLYWRPATTVHNGQTCRTKHTRHGYKRRINMSIDSSLDQLLSFSRPITNAVTEHEDQESCEVPWFRGLAYILSSWSENQELSGSCGPGIREKRSSFFFVYWIKKIIDRPMGIIMAIIFVLRKYRIYFLKSFPYATIFRKE